MNVHCLVSRTITLDEPTKKLNLAQPLAYTNAKAHAMQVVVMDEGEVPADLTGIGCTASFKRSDNTTVEPINGTVTGNVAQVILPASCYVIPGRFTFTMNLSDTNGATRTALWVEGMVEKNTSNEIVDPGTPVGNIEQAVGNANAAASAATTAATAANTAATNAANAAKYTAPTEASSTASKAYAVGDYFVYNGKLYITTSAIASGGTITPNTNCAEIPNGLSGEVGDLKSALDDSIGGLSVTPDWQQGSINSSGQIVSNNFYKYTATAIKVYKGNTYTIENGNEIYRIKYYENEPTVGTTWPTSQTNAVQESYTPDKDGWIALVAKNNDIGDIYRRLAPSSTLLGLGARVDTIEQEHENSLHASDLLENTVLYRADEIEIGATHNNDSGNTTYIFKNIVKTDKVGCVFIRVKNITNARTDSVVVYYYNSATIQNNSTLISSRQVNDKIIKEGTLLIPPQGTLFIIIELYPSITGGLTDEYAVYSDVFVGVTSYRINPIDLIQKEIAPVPYYYFQNDYLKNKISAIRQAITASGGNYDAFIFCTDQHWRLNARNSPSIIRYLSEELNIKRLFTGGDYADGINMDALKAFKKSIDGAVYNVTGNHEYMNYFEEDNVMASDTINEADVWLYMNGGMTDAVIGDSGRQYYYVDNPTQKMRYIILSVYADNGSAATYAFEAAQKEWLRDTALNVPVGYTVVIFAHFLCGFDYDTGAITTGINTDISSVVDSYAGSGEIACLIAGHTHVDGMTTTPGGIPVFVTTCDKYYPWMQGNTDMEPWLTANRHLGTITEQAFDVVVIDKKNKKNTFIRIGAPADNGASPKLEVRVQNYGA